MSLFIEKIKVHDFLCFGDVEIDLTKYTNNVILVKGKNNDVVTDDCGDGKNIKNGTGKSTIKKSLVYCLYGKFSSKKITKDNFLRWNRTENDMYVEVTFVCNSTRYLMHRGIHGKALTAEVQLYKVNPDGTQEDISKPSADETTKYVETVLTKCPFDLFVRNVLCDTDPLYDYMNMNAETLKKFKNTLFDLGKVAKLCDEFTADKKAVMDEKKAKTNEIMNLNRLADKCKSDIELFDTNKENEIARFEKLYTEAKKAYEQESANIVKQNKESADKCRKVSQAIDNKIAKITDQINKATGTANRSAANIQNIRSQKKLHSDFITKHSKITGMLCEDCLKKYEKVAKIDKYRDEIVKLDENETSETKNYQLSIDDISTMKKDLAALRKKKQDVDKYFQEQTSAYNTQQAKLNTLVGNMKAYETSLEIQKSSVNPYKNMLSNFTNELDKANSDLDEINDRLNYMNMGAEVFSKERYQAEITKQYIGILNGYVKSFMSRVGVNYGFEFNEDLSFNMTCFQPGIEPSYYNFSNGEQQRIKIAVNMAISQFMARIQNFSCNLMFIDEVLDCGLDTNGVITCVNELRDMARRDNKNIIIVTHRPEVTDDMADYRWDVVKEDGKSTISENKIETV